MKKLDVIVLAQILLHTIPSRHVLQSYYSIKTQETTSNASSVTSYKETDGRLENATANNRRDKSQARRCYLRIIPSSPFIFHPQDLHSASTMAVPASSNPITSVAPNSNPITSVSPNNYAASPLYPSPTNPQLLSRLNLDLRGTIFPVEREMLMLLPESVLLGLFPQGLILSKPASWEGADDGIFTVDVSRVCTEWDIHNYPRRMCY